MAFIAFSVYVAIQPNSYKVVKTKTINAPKEVVFEFITNLENSSQWMNSNDAILTITELNKHKSIQLDKQSPNAPTAKVNWNLEDKEGDKTKFTWDVESTNLPFMFKAKQVFKGNIDSIIGNKIESSWTKLDSLLKVKMNLHSIKTEGVTQHSGGFYIYKEATCKLSEFTTKKAKLFESLLNYIEQHHIIPSGAPFTIFHQRDTENDVVQFSCAIPTSTELTIENNDISAGYLPAFKTIKTQLSGDYKYLNAAWKATHNYLTENNLKPTESVFKMESYIKTPHDSKNPADWVTEIFIAVE